MIFIVLLGMMVAIVAAGRIDPQIFRNINSYGTSDVLVSFKKSNVPCIRARFIKLHKQSDRATRLNSFYRNLKDHADRTQHEFSSSLERSRAFKSVEIRQLWISNQLIILNAPMEAIRVLEESEAVSKAEADNVIPLPSPTFNDAYATACNSTTSDELPWGISRIEASPIWADGFRGQGVVVSNVDTGVQYTHEALKDNYRTEYGWFDPYDLTRLPHDQNGHGTHTMGTLVGRVRAIGVAPEAKWVACRACNEYGCSSFALLQCGQWTVCPTEPDGRNPKCSMAPLVISNTLGGPRGDGFYDDILAAYDAVGIHAIFTIGNKGPQCGTTAYPGESPRFIGVGATTMDDSVAAFSSVGPPSYGNETIKPDVSAPGLRICSASHLSDNGYVEFEGASMACPHVAGLVALMLSKEPSVSVSNVHKCVRNGTVPTKSTGGNCGGIPDDIFPNFHAGYGRISAPATFKCLGGLMD